MPHLSPMSWITAPFIFWVLFTYIISVLWWFQTPSFPSLASAFKSPSPNSWNW